MVYRIMRPASLTVLAVMITILLSVGVQPTLNATRNKAMPAQTSELVGNWKKRTHSACSQIYPDRIQLKENGLYSAQNDSPARFIVWDAGTYEIIDPKQVKISLANDAIITYEFSVSGDVLTFIDPDGCEFKYGRVT